LRFFERAEIKDALAYLRLVANRDDDPSFERVANTPPRASVNGLLTILRETGRTRGGSLWQALVQLLTTGGLSGRAANAVRGFLNLIEQLDHNSREQPLPERVEHVIVHSGLRPCTNRLRPTRARCGSTTWKNWSTPAATSSLTPIRSWWVSIPTEPDWLNAFLAHAVLESGQGQGSAGDDCVQLMTLHMAKGWSFRWCSWSGWKKACSRTAARRWRRSQLEEERRLAYVGVTRARRQLYLCYAEQRTLYGQRK
jgi:DNA helicase-2/ATP-dependent DNA helicase PcrA